MSKNYDKKEITNEKPKNYKKYLSYILVILVLTNIFSIYHHLTENDFTNPYPMIDPTRSLISQKDFIVNIQPIRESIRSKTTEFEKGGREVSLYIEFLNTGANISINPDSYIWPASLTKLPLAMAVMKKVENGDWSLSNELVLLSEDRNIKSGERNNPLAEFPIGTRFTIEKILEELLVNSDNTAYNILLRNLHSDEVQIFIDEIGLEKLFTPDGKISSKEYARIYRSLYTSSFLKRENSQKILNWLDQSTFDDFLADGVPDDVKFPHKYGENITYGVYADSGIVYLEHRPYLVVLVVQSDKYKPFKQESEEVKKYMREVSVEVFNYFKDYEKNI